MSSWPMLLLVIAIITECGREAFFDGTPRMLANDASRPRRPHLVWWAVRHSPTDYVKHTVRMQHGRGVPQSSTSKGGSQWP